MESKVVYFCTIMIQNLGLIFLRHKIFEISKCFAQEGKKDREREKNYFYLKSFLKLGEMKTKRYKTRTYELAVWIDFYAKKSCKTFIQLFLSHNYFSVTESTLSEIIVSNISQSIITRFTSAIDIEWSLWWMHHICKRSVRGNKHCKLMFVATDATSLPRRDWRNTTINTIFVFEEDPNILPSNLHSELHVKIVLEGKSTIVKSRKNWFT